MSLPERLISDYDRLFASVPVDKLARIVTSPASDNGAIWNRPVIGAISLPTNLEAAREIKGLSRYMRRQAKPRGRRFPDKIIKRPTCGLLDWEAVSVAA